LFIDHAGLGGHNVGEPGIDRHGRSAALNALYGLALDSLSDLERQFGSQSESARRKQMAEKVRAAAAAAYWDGSRELFVDVVDERGRRSEKASQQTNILAVLAEWPCPLTQRELIRRVLKPGETNAQCGPYFYAYLLPLMHRLGMHTEALNLIREKWGPMLDAGATTLWETFCGDGHDTWCHPWAAIPAAFLTNHILGLNARESGSQEVVLRPRYDLLASAGGSIPTDAGQVELKWVVQGSTARLSGVVPPGMRGTLFTCDGTESLTVSSAWQLDLPLPAPCIVTHPLVIKRRSSIYT
jgi:alpha-L-rhamnosidase